MVLTGGLLAVVSIVRAGAVRATMHRVLQIFVGMLPGWEMPKFAVPADRRLTLPYGVAITLGSIMGLTTTAPLTLGLAAPMDTDMADLATAINRTILIHTAIE